MRKEVKNLVFLILFFSKSLHLEANDNINEFELKFSKYLDSVKKQNSDIYDIGNGGISYLDNIFQVNYLNDNGNYNFNQLKYEGINLNCLYDKSFDYSLISYDESLNFNGNEFLNNFNLIENKNLQLQFVGGSVFGNANLFAQGCLSDVKVRTRNNYYVSNGFNNPKGTLFNPLSDITKQSFQSTLNLSLSDSRTTIEYNQLILSNLTKNNYTDSENEFKNFTNFNSIFTLNYTSQNSDYVSTNGMLFLKYSNRIINLTDKNQFIKDNELSYGVSIGALFKFFDEPTRLNMKYSQMNLDFYFLSEYNEYRVEDLIINLNQKISIYENNVTSIGASASILNPIDKLNKIQYNKIVDYGLSVDFQHFNKTSGLINEFYINIKYENEIPAFKYLFASNIADDDAIPEFNFQNRIGIGNKTTFEFLNFTSDFNVSYIRFNEYYNIDTIWLASKLNESWILNFNFSLSYWKLYLDAHFSQNLLNKTFIILDRINKLPSMFVKVNLKAKISENTIIKLILSHFEFNYDITPTIDLFMFHKNSTLINIKLDQIISDNINLFLSINNILDEQIPLFPFYNKPGFNYVGGITVKL